MPTNETVLDVPNKSTKEIVPLTGYRNLNDVENFYRFVYENKVRKEAYLIFQTIVERLSPKKKQKKVKRSRAKKH